MDYSHVSANEGHTLHDEILRKLHPLEQGWERVPPAVHFLTLENLYRVICEEKVDDEGALDRNTVGADVVPVRIKPKHLAVVCKILGNAGLGVLCPTRQKNPSKKQLRVFSVPQSAPSVQTSAQSVQILAIFDAEDWPENQGI
jgi:hypothetical protein